jgi:hypothetical protein
MRELAKKQKQEEKRLRKVANKDVPQASEALPSSDAEQ